MNLGPRAKSSDDIIFWPAFSIARLAVRLSMHRFAAVRNATGKIARLVGNYRMGRAMDDVADRSNRKVGYSGRLLPETEAFILARTRE